MGKRRRRESRKKGRRRNVYLGRVVPDTGRPGLDNLREVRGICRAVLRDYETGRISRRRASSRLALLHNVVIPRDRKLRRKRRAEEIVEEYWSRL
ncbi:MAG: hypothetical protein GXO00_02175 [Candidatus Diapherotrites archaeon]|nr:hypothetical protein [Candidatus Diapherotrites archaeon]